MRLATAGSTAALESERVRAAGAPVREATPLTLRTQLLVSVLLLLALSSQAHSANAQITIIRLARSIRHPSRGSRARAVPIRISPA